MIAEHTDSGATEAANVAQQLKGVGPLVDKIPGKPETVDVRVEIKLLEESQQVIEAALNITNGVGGRCTPSQSLPIRQVEIRFQQVSVIVHSVTFFGLGSNDIPADRPCGYRLGSIIQLPRELDQSELPPLALI